VRPEGLAAAGIDHDLDVRPDRLAGRANEEFVGLRVAPAERLPTELDGTESTSDGLCQLLAERFDFVEE
jgi:hypothetical protein